MEKNSLKITKKTIDFKLKGVNILFSSYKEYELKNTIKSQFKIF